MSLRQAMTMKMKYSESGEDAQKSMFFIYSASHKFGHTYSFQCFSLFVSHSDLSSIVLVWSGRELGWAVCVLFSIIWDFCVRPGMVLNQRQLSIVVPD